VPGLLLALGDSGRNAVGLTQSDPDAAFTVADDDQGAEVKASAAFDDLRDAPDLYYPILKLRIALTSAATTASAASSIIVPLTTQDSIS
jgi:hypothetical protein